MSKFLEYKRNVLNYFDDCISFAKRNGYEANSAQMQSLRKKIEEDKMVVLTCGEMKRGKSSMLSALLEDVDLFPVNVAVATCVVTMVSYAPVEKVTVVLEDRRGQETSISITRSEISDYVTEQGNESNHKKVKLMLIETPNEKLKNGFVFVDTPGVGSMNPEHSQITYGFLPRADVVLFVSDATSPLTEPELGFLKQVKTHCSNILFPLTKKDLEANYQEIIETNKDKINQYTDIPRDKIAIIPISSTAKLSYLKTGRDRMLKSSNYEAFEKMLWDMIYKNRANIIFFPPMKELADELKKIEKDICINETAFGGNSDDMEKLKDKLVQLSNQKQELLSNASGWQIDIQKEVEGLIYSTDSIIDTFYDDAMSYLNKQLQNPKNIADPTALLNGVVCMVSNSSIEMSNEVLSRVSEIKENFEEKSGISFYDDEDRSLFSIKEADFNLKKLTTTEKLVDNGRTIGATSMGITAIGSVAGAVIGGIIGLFGGPVGLIAGAQVGAMLGGAAGTINGTLRVLKQPTYHTENQVRNEITKYITGNCNAWRKDTPRHLKEIKDNLIAALKKGIEESKGSLDKDIAHIKDVAELTKVQLNEGMVKYQKRKEEYTVLGKRFAALIKEKVEDDSERPTISAVSASAREEAAPAKQEDAVKAPVCISQNHKNSSETRNADYSFLED